ncbi:TetR/AcrR family transcriptional regulator [Streptomyces sp. NPDC047928]|uniref:TetR/AcrR family transcriptional regulator n=1 Tax=unclassified Streptomyces TaxID=2593676 RepID=UPI003714897B
MPTAREALLDAALAALGDLPWTAVRMVDVAAAAGVSRQTLYNEFGSKDGLARALVRREADTCLRGVDRALAGQAAAHRPGAGPPDAGDRLVAVAEWLVGAARARPLLRALLTGCWGDGMPEPPPARGHRVSAGARVPGRTPGRVPGPARAPLGPPAQRRADTGVPGPGELLAAVRDRSAAALERHEAQRAREAHEAPGTYEAHEAPATYEAHEAREAYEAPEAHQAREVSGGQETPEAPEAHDPWGRRCELAVRIALSYVVAPGPGGVGPLVRTVISATSPTAGGR